MKKKILFALALTSLLTLASCKEEKEYLSTPISDSQFYTGTYVKISVYDKDKEQALEDAYTVVGKAVSEIEVNEQGISELDKINNSAGDKPVKVTKGVYKLVEESVDFAKKTHGAYDPAIGAVTAAWHIGFPDAHVPTDEELAGLVKLTDYHDIKLDKEAQTVYLEKEGMRIDLGGVGKAWLAEKAIDSLKKAGVTKAVLEFGGHTFLIGKSSSNKDGKWTIGIENPSLPIELKADAKNSIGRITTDKSVLIETNMYARHLDVDGKIYSHLMDPKTARPYDNDLLSVIIIGDDPIEADFLSNAVYDMGLDKGLAYMNEHKDAQAILVDKEKTVYLTNGLIDDVVLDKDSGFQLAN